MSKKNRSLMTVLSFAIVTGSLTNVALAADEHTSSKAVVSQSKAVENTKKLVEETETKSLKKKAKEILEETSESSPLTSESKEEIVDYYADKYMPKKGCSLVEELPKDSDINYVKPKPKPKPKPKKKVEAKIKSTKQVSNTSKTTSSSNKTSSNSANPTNHIGNTISMDDESRDWLEKIIEAEAGGESYEGKLAVATVIANRVESSKFPNTVMSVIKAGSQKQHQFSPWDDGRIYKVSASSTTKQAVSEVFDKGVRNLPADTTYFAVKTIAFNDWIGKTRKYVSTIGNHAFFSQYAK